MARGMVLQKIKPFHPELKPPPGAIPFGRTADGKHQLYRMTSKRSRAVPRFVNTPEAKAREKELQDEGKTPEQVREVMLAEGYQDYRKNRTTGESAYPLNRAEFFDLEEIFYLLSEGNGNIRKEPYRPPTEAQLASDRRRLQVQALGGGRLAELLVDEGITAEEVVGAIKGRRARPIVRWEKSAQSHCPCSPGSVRKRR